MEDLLVVSLQHHAVSFARRTSFKRRPTPTHSTICLTGWYERGKVADFGNRSPKDIRDPAAIALYFREGVPSPMDAGAGGIRKMEVLRELVASALRRSSAAVRRLINLGNRGNKPRGIIECQHTRQLPIDESLVRWAPVSLWPRLGLGPPLHNRRPVNDNSAGRQ